MIRKRLRKVPVAGTSGFARIEWMVSIIHPILISIH